MWPHPFVYMIMNWFFILLISIGYACVWTFTSVLAEKTILKDELGICFFLGMVWPFALPCILIGMIASNTIEKINRK